MIQKLFVIRKHIYAKDLADALKKEKKHPADEAWVAEDFIKNNSWIDIKDKEMGFRKK